MVPNLLSTMIVFNYCLLWIFQKGVGFKDFHHPGPAYTYSAVAIAAGSGHFPRVYNRNIPQSIATRTHQCLPKRNVDSVLETEGEKGGMDLSVCPASSKSPNSVGLSAAVYDSYKYWLASLFLPRHPSYLHKVGDHPIFAPDSNLQAFQCSSS